MDQQDELTDEQLHSFIENPPAFEDHCPTCAVIRIMLTENQRDLYQTNAGFHHVIDVLFSALPTMVRGAEIDALEQAEARIKSWESVAGQPIADSLED